MRHKIWKKVFETKKCLKAIQQILKKFLTAKIKVLKAKKNWTQNKNWEQKKKRIESIKEIFEKKVSESKNKNCWEKKFESQKKNCKNLLTAKIKNLKAKEIECNIWYFYLQRDGINIAPYVFSCISCMHFWRILMQFKSWRHAPLKHKKDREREQKPTPFIAEAIDLLLPGMSENNILLEHSEQFWSQPRFSPQQRRMLSSAVRLSVPLASAVLLIHARLPSGRFVAVDQEFGGGLCHSS